MTGAGARTACVAPSLAQSNPMEEVEVGTSAFEVKSDTEVRRFLTHAIIGLWSTKNECRYVDMDFN